MESAEREFGGRPEVSLKVKLALRWIADAEFGAMQMPELTRFFVRDPFGNRLEIQAM